MQRRHLDDRHGEQPPTGPRGARGRARRDHIAAIRNNPREHPRQAGQQRGVVDTSVRLGACDRRGRQRPPSAVLGRRVTDRPDASAPSRRDLGRRSTAPAPRALQCGGSAGDLVLAGHVAGQASVLRRNVLLPDPMPGVSVPPKATDRVRYTAPCVAGDAMSDSRGSNAQRTTTQGILEAPFLPVPRGRAAMSDSRSPIVPGPPGLLTVSFKRGGGGRACRPRRPTGNERLIPRRRRGPGSSRSAPAQDASSNDVRVPRSVPLTQASSKRRSSTLGRSRRDVRIPRPIPRSQDPSCASSNRRSSGLSGLEPRCPKLRVLERAAAGAEGILRAPFLAPVTRRIHQPDLAELWCIA